MMIPSQAGKKCFQSMANYKSHRLCFIQNVSRGATWDD